MRLRWRTGRTLGRTIYVQVGDEPSKDDVLIGMMDTHDLAARVVEAHNLAVFLMRMGDPGDVEALERRRTITMNQIVRLARDAVVEGRRE